MGFGWVCQLVDIVVKHPVAPSWPRRERAAFAFAVVCADQAVAVFVGTHGGDGFACIVKDRDQAATDHRAQGDNYLPSAFAT